MVVNYIEAKNPNKIEATVIITNIKRTKNTILAIKILPRFFFSDFFLSFFINSCKPIKITIRMIVPKIILIGFPPNKKSHPAKRDRVVQTFDFKVRAVFIYLR